MQVQLESAQGTQRRLRVVVPASEVQGKVDARLRQHAKGLNLKGFRPGKVPLQEVKRRFGPQVRSEVSGQLVQASFQSAIAQRQINLVGQPQVADLKFEDGKDLEYTATFDVMPELQVGGLERITVQRPVAKLRDKDLDKVVETLRDQRTKFVPVARPARKGDLVEVDCSATWDGEPYPPAELKSARLLLNGGIKPKGLEKGMRGLADGEQKTFPVTMHKDSREEVAGKVLEFTVAMQTVREPQRPELDADFFKEFDLAETSLQAFRAEVRRNMERELAAAVRRHVKTQALDGLIALNPFDAPRSVVEAEARQLRVQGIRQLLGQVADAAETLKQLKQGGDAELDGYPAHLLPIGGFLAAAERLVRASILVQKLIEAHQLEPDEARVRAMIETEASSYEDRQQVIDFFYQNEAQLARVKGLALEDQVVDLILDTAKVKDKRLPYEEVLKPPQAAAPPPPPAPPPQAVEQSAPAEPQQPASPAQATASLEARLPEVPALPPEELEAPALESPEPALAEDLAAAAATDAATEAAAAALAEPDNVQPEKETQA